MPRETRAILFDLDDTLYPLERFVLSGLDAVARGLADRFGRSADEYRTVLLNAFHNGGRGRELQICVRSFDLPADITPLLIGIIRSHRPSIDLPEASAIALRSLASSWRIGIVTNGHRDIQSRKVAALGLEQCVDAIVFADGDCAKPAAAPFLEAARRLNVAPSRSIFVGNDPLCDVYGAWRLGMKTIHVADRSAAHSALMADASVRSLVEVPDIAERLVA